MQQIGVGGTIRSGRVGPLSYHRDNDDLYCLATSTIFLGADGGACAGIATNQKRTDLLHVWCQLHVRYMHIQGSMHVHHLQCMPVQNKTARSTYLLIHCTFVHVLFYIIIIIIIIMQQHGTCTIGAHMCDNMARYM
jgi:hypothetical protein